MRYDTIIIGGGIVGLATAYQLLRKNPSLKLAVLEKESQFAQHQTGHNSGVIHSGLYYKPGSLKARNCINGYHMLVDFCQQNTIPFELCGKVVVATDESEKPWLDTLFERGTENGLKGLKMLNREQLKEYEPHVNGLAGIHVPQTGIINYSKVANAFSELIKKTGGELFLATRVLSITTQKDGSRIQTENRDFETRLVINCAGLYSDKIARMTEDKVNLKIVPFRGEYYQVKPEKEYLVRNLIYPVPDPAFPFLGVHFTRMIEGGVEAGPNAVLAFMREGYRKNQINLKELTETLRWPGFQKVAAKYWKTGFGEMYRSFSKKAFTRALQKLLPEITEADLIPGGAGVRAQACDRSGGLLDDFNIIESAEAIHVCNAPSPAATSSLAIGDTVSDMALKRWQD